MQQSNNQQCGRCHSEHNGVDFQIVHWEPSQQAFDHDKTGYTLEGKHATLTCRQCHNAAHVLPAERAGLKGKDLNRTFLGLSQNCVTCHKDAHGGRLGENCAQCHSFNDWKTVPRFDHSKTRFPLTGEHVHLACQKCHRPDEKNRELMQLVGMPFSKCADCHTDPHHGKFKPACESCHSTAGWKQVSQARVTVQFDHSETRYALLGKHADVRCDQCHQNGDFARPLAFVRCLNCHSDPHHGQFVARDDGGDCAGCHTVNGFKPSTFGVGEHAATKYPLEGRHASVACEKCHLPAGVNAAYRIRLTTCRSCHADPHGGQFAGAPHHDRCEDCHTVQGFAPSTFTLSRHQESRFPLTGGHIAIPCIECHEAMIPPGSGRPAPYHFQDLSCTECHDDPHRGEFGERMARLRPDGKPFGCEVCHSTESWTERVRFDHASTAFPLLGAHRAVACMDCHKPPNLETTLRNLDFRAAPTQCDACHVDPHGGQFVHNGASPQCSSCHNTSRWKPSLFDHETRTVFPLKGAHQDVPCSGCHKVFKDIGGRAVLFYQPTSTQCVACHGPNVPKER